MDPKAALKAYRQQQHNAAYRGIAWELNFHQWCEWWGDDIERRGYKHDSLSMQRIADSGPYALWNIRKGFPRDNTKTKGIMQRNKNATQNALSLEERCRALLARISHGPHDDTKLDEDQRYFANRRKLRSCIELLGD